ncbi:MAG: nucleotidyl transferase AbiEii/AbiGii toxin family protein [Balneolaceae bacterium]
MNYEELSYYNLIGGTGLSIHLEHRLSEDIDLFCYNPSYPGKRFPLPNKDLILDRFKNDFDSIHYILNETQDVTLILNDVKVQLRSEHQFHGPKKASKLGYINHPSSKDLLGMKIVALYLRNTWRDVYDLTCLANKFNLTEFYPAYESIMSSKYCGSKARKPKLFNDAISKLKDQNLLTSLHTSDPMNHLITQSHITPSDVINTFTPLELIPIQQQNRGFSM